MARTPPIKVVAISTRVFNELTKTFYETHTFTAVTVANNMGLTVKQERDNVISTLTNLAKGNVYITRLHKNPSTYKLLKKPEGRMLEERAKPRHKTAEEKERLLEAMTLDLRAKVADPEWPKPVEPEPEPEPASTDKWFRERWTSTSGLLDVGTLFRQIQYHIDHGIKAIDADAIPDEIIKAQFVKRFL